jgi:CubicO group peptidase (beta-lactamase class C family)
VHRSLVAFILVAVFAGFGQRTSAQGFTFSLFERYLESLRENAGIPGMSALVLQGGHEVWSSGFGRADIDSSARPTPDTPYLIGGLSQTFGATLLLKKCFDESFATLSDPVAEWVPGFSESTTTIVQLLAHVANTGAFRYDLTRFAALTAVVETCSDTTYAPLLWSEILAPMGMAFSSPGTALVNPTASDLAQFEPEELAHFAEVVSRLARPYHVDRGRHVRTELSGVRVNAATGIVSSVRDLARFDQNLTHGGVLDSRTLQLAWQQVVPGIPSGLGWLVQAYNREPVVWQFGRVDGAYSSLMVKVPNRDLTFILLANSDALAAPFNGDSLDVTASLFARLFLLTFAS